MRPLDARGVERPSFETFARRPREALMWVPRSRDVARIAAACRAAGPRVVDVGAGTGLLARLLADAGVDVEAYEPGDLSKRYHHAIKSEAEAIPPGAHLAIVSWMEAGRDYRAAVARLAPAIVNVYDVEGGCGVKGDVSFEAFGYETVDSWRTASFEDAAYALDTRGALKRKAWPGNRIAVLARGAPLAARLRAALSAPPTLPPYPWEAQMDRLGL